MYHPLIDGASDQEVRAFYAKRHEQIDKVMQEVWSLRGCTIREDWHMGYCDECDFLFDADGKNLGPCEDSKPKEGHLGYYIEQHKLNVTYAKKSVKITNKQDPNPVEGRADTLIMAYVNWLLAVEQQKVEEKKKCAVT